MNPFRLTIYDGQFARKGWLGDPLEVDATVRFNDVSMLSVDVSLTNQKLPLLLAPGARMTCEYLGGQILSGPIRTKRGKGPTGKGILTFDVMDDFRLIKNMLAWPVPESAISNQATREYWTRTGPVETVAKAVIEANLARYPSWFRDKITVEPDQGRGPNVSLQWRMHPIYDRLFPAFDQSGLGLRVRQDGTAGLVVEVYTPPAPRSQVLSEASGAIRDWSWVDSAPENTRVVVGGQGEGTLRTFRAYQNDTRESEFRDVIEVFRDARDSDGAGDIYAERATETLAEGVAKTGLSVEFAETDHLKFGVPGGINLGQILNLQVGPYVTIQDRLIQAGLKYDSKNGLVVSPKIGEVETSDDGILAKAIARIAAELRNRRSI